MRKTEKSLKLSEFLSYIKKQVKIDLLKSNAKNLINLESDQLEKVSKVVSNSIELSFIEGSLIIKDIK